MTAPDCATVAGRLDEYAAGGLAPDDRAAVEAHLAGCAACRRALDRAQALPAALSALPRSIDPPAAVWEGIVARRRGPAPRWARLAAAAALLVAVSSSATWLLTRAPGPAAAPEAALPTVLAPYAAASDELTRAFEAERAALSPATREVLDRNLRIIDQAIAESRQALAADPSSRVATDLVVAAYRQKLSLLERALGARTAL